MSIDVKVSTKYQVVIPKEIRRELGIKPGQTLRVRRVNKKLVIDTESVVDKYAGTMQGAWGDEDPVAIIRRMRDEEWQ